MFSEGQVLGEERFGAFFGGSVLGLRRGAGVCEFSIERGGADGLSVPTVGDGAGFCVFSIDNSMDDGLSCLRRAAF